MQETCSYPGYIRSEVVSGPLFMGSENRTRNEEGNIASISDHFYTVHNLPLSKQFSLQSSNVFFLIFGLYFRFQL